MAAAGHPNSIKQLGNPTDQQTGTWDRRNNLAPTQSSSSHFSQGLPSPESKEDLATPAAVTSSTASSHFGEQRP